MLQRIELSIVGEKAIIKPRTGSDITEDDLHCMFLKAVELLSAKQCHTIVWDIKNSFALTADAIVFFEGLRVVIAKNKLPVTVECGGNKFACLNCFLSPVSCGKFTSSFHRSDLAIMADDSI